MFAVRTSSREGVRWASREGVRWGGAAAAAARRCAASAWRRSPCGGGAVRGRTAGAAAGAAGSGVPLRVSKRSQLASDFRFERAASRDLPPPAMAERGARDTCSGTSAVVGVRPEDGDDLLARWELWQTEHPRRNRVQVYSRGNWRPAGAASGAPGPAAPGAPAPVSYSEVVCVPFAQRIRRGAGVRRVAEEPTLFQYVDSASLETYQHTTSIQRMAALANSHPLVATMRLSCLRHVLDDDALVDREGRAKTTADGCPPRHQSPYDLSLSLGLSQK